MSLFQCSKCGCIENTACTSGYHMMWQMDKRDVEAAASYRKVLGLAEDDMFGNYCSACSPIWFTPEGGYGIGPGPVGQGNGLMGDVYGVWHGKFKRTFLPKGKFHTNGDGNLSHIETLDTNVDKYALESEDQPGLHVLPPEERLPRPGTHEERNYLKKGKPAQSMTNAGVAAMIAMAASSGLNEAPQRYVPPPPPPTPEQLAAEQARSEAKIKKAEEKRIRKAERIRKQREARVGAATQD